MDVNDDTCFQKECGVFECIASKLAPTGVLGSGLKPVDHRPVMPEVDECLGANDNASGALHLHVPRQSP
ncbi:hypothetical protein D3C76_1030620 [compost metagenome]